MTSDANATTSATTNATPGQIGRYQLERVLGRGAMGTVYLATDPHIQRQVALKTIHATLLNDGQGTAGPSGAELTARFLNEARAAGRLVHPHIVGVFDYGEAEDVAFIALEYVRGENLAQRLAQHRRDGSTIPLMDALAWFAQLLDALAYAHELGVIHRDIKPANLLIAPRGECKVTDFGIAQLDTGRLTQAGMMIGTPSYMSPEQYAGGQIDARSDLFSAGVVLYEMLSGRCPFSGASAAVMHQVMNDMPPPPSTHVVGLPAELDAMVLKALAKRPDDRYACARSWQSALFKLQHTLTMRLDPDHTVVRAQPSRQALAPPVAGVASGWPPAFLAQLEQRLASHVGPIASLLVRRAASQATDSRTLAAQLARHFPDDSSRREFDTLLKQHAIASTGGSMHRTLPVEPASVADVPLGPEQIETAARRLASYVGPIARIIAERAARGADEATFRARLADALPASVDRTAFLRALDEPTR
ncbi:serine/threonine protein kinase [Paraburkholderia sp. LEh10]|uniref:serine/threonine-protein kinase n=1 Tax=Paraburkholderia sp. LEh10 TaxID=2821353 RepID=UPI001AEAE64A|nr:serine/threonine-protein kinase [Paraburkholderia sp. LEh10]MBP0590302.1 serine/threonine protein kinase [Paraburkholderia sp. LEh10]